MNLVLNAQKLSKIPIDLNAFFPNLKMIQISGNNLTTINRTEILSFPKLIYLDVSRNHIKKLEQNLFTSTRELEIIDFSLNDIAEIGFGVLDPLKNILSASFRGNECIDQSFVPESSISLLVLQLGSNCSSVIHDIIKPIASETPQLVKLQEQVSKMEKDNKVLRERVEDIEFLLMETFNKAMVFDQKNVRT